MRIGNCKVTSKALWPVANYLMNRDGPKGPTDINSVSGLKYHLSEKVNNNAG
jgi:hypothetical protein